MVRVWNGAGRASVGQRTRPLSVRHSHDRAFYRLEELLHATTYLTLLAVSNDLVMVLLSERT